MGRGGVVAAWLLRRKWVIGCFLVTVIVNQYMQLDSLNRGNFSDIL